MFNIFRENEASKAPPGTEVIVGYNLVVNPNKRFESTYWVSGTALVPKEKPKRTRKAPQK